MKEESLLSCKVTAKDRNDKVYLKYDPEVIIAKGDFKEMYEFAKSNGFVSFGEE